MNRARYLALTALSAALVLTGCSGGGGQAAPTATITKTQTATSTPTVTETQTASPSTEASETISDAEIADLAMRMTWQQMPRSDRQNICTAWREELLPHEEMVEAFQSGSEGTFRYEQVSDFFDAKCGSPRDPALLRRIWNHIPKGDREDICEVWIARMLPRDEMIDGWRKATGKYADPFTDEQIAEFIDSRCLG